MTAHLKFSTYSHGELPHSIFRTPSYKPHPPSKNKEDVFFAAFKMTGIILSAGFQRKNRINQDNKQYSIGNKHQ
jgi:hypothetical protein